MASRVLRLWNPDLAAWEPVGDPRLSGYLPLTLVDADTRYVNTAGDTMTGALTAPGIDATGTLRLYSPSGTAATVQFLTVPGYERLLLGIDQSSGQPRWALLPGNGAVETGSNAGTDFDIRRYSDAGALLGTALTLSRATGAATFGGAVTAASLALSAPTTTTTATAGAASALPGVPQGYLSISIAGTVRKIPYWNA